MNNLYINENVDLGKMCSGWTNKEFTYELETEFDEFISIDKGTRLVQQCGYNGVVHGWLAKNIASYK